MTENEMILDLFKALCRPDDPGSDRDTLTRARRAAAEIAAGPNENHIWLSQDLEGRHRVCIAPSYDRASNLLRDAGIVYTALMAIGRPSPGRSRQEKVLEVIEKP